MSSFVVLKSISEVLEQNDKVPKGPLGRQLPAWEASGGGEEKEWWGAEWVVQALWSAGESP